MRHDFCSSILTFVFSVCGHSVALIKSYWAWSGISLEYHRYFRWSDWASFSCTSLLTFAKSCRRLKMLYFSPIQSHSSLVSSIIMCMNVVSSVYLLFSMHMFVLYCLSCKKKKRPFIHKSMLYPVHCLGCFLSVCVCFCSYICSDYQWAKEGNYSSFTLSCKGLANSFTFLSLFWNRGFKRTH